MLSIHPLSYQIALSAIATALDNIRRGRVDRGEALLRDALVFMRKLSEAQS